MYTYTFFFFFEKDGDEVKDGEKNEWFEFSVYGLQNKFIFITSVRMRVNRIS